MDAVDGKAKAGFRVRAFRREDIRVRHETNFLEEGFAGAVGDVSDGGTKRNRDKSEGEGDTPLATTDAVNGKGGSSDENDKHLYGDFYCTCKMISLSTQWRTREERTNQSP